MLRTAHAIILSFSLLCCTGAHAATTFWAGTTLGLLKSADSGLTWKLVDTTTSNAFLSGTLTVQAITLDPQQPATIYFAAGAVSSGANGFFRSNDNGATWTGITLIGFGFSSATLVVDPVLTNVIYLAGGGKLHKSTDYGDTWTEVTVPASPNAGFSADPSASGTLYISNTIFVYKSTDYGATWTKLPAVAQPVQGYFAGPVTVDPKSSKTLYVADGYPFVSGACGTISQNQECGLFKSADGGQTWKNVAPAGVYDTVAFDSKNGTIYTSGSVPGLGSAVLKSTDNGDTWNPTNNQVATMILLADPAAAATLVGYHPYPTGSTIYRTTDGGATWTTVNMPNLAVGSTRVPYVQCMTVAKPLGIVSSTTFSSGPVAPESIVSALGFDLAIQPLIPNPPATNVGGTTVTVIDANGVSRSALIFYASGIEVNFQIPPQTALRTAIVLVNNGNGTTYRIPIEIASVTPGIYELNSGGLAAAYALRARGTVHTYENVYQLDNLNNIVPLPIDLTPTTDGIYLELYGTGFRFGGTPAATINNVSIPVLYAGAQGQFPGEDQADIGPIPSSMIGAGTVPIVLTVSGVPANTVYVTIK